MRHFLNKNFKVFGHNIFIASYRGKISIVIDAFTPSAKRIWIKK